ncbi:MAG TPA: right-handed parallel beta-helix repeat-containing protein [Micromonosporaceae bacterium]
MRRLSRMLVLVFAAVAATTATTTALLATSSAPASAHDERESVAPDGTGSVPTYRTGGPTVLVCKTDKADFEQRLAGFPAELRASNLALWDQCQKDGYRHLQEAVDHAQPGTNIKMLPGVYQEEPSLAEPSGQCASLSARRASLGYQVLSWEQQVACPHNQNLVAILNKRDLQIEGTGAKPEDVIVDAQFQRLNAIRADRASGIYLRNFTAQRSTFNAVYIMESDGFVIDRLIGRWNDEYGFLTFADDHGLYTDCEAYGNGDSGVYPGAASNINGSRGHDVDRYAIEIRRCNSHHNLLGYSGTAGDSVWAHDNSFTQNTVGVATDSAFPDHPGLPQNHAKFERNIIADNNVDYYGYVRDGTCKKPFPQRGYEQGVVCPAVGVPVGTGVINPGGNYNVWRDNWVYNNSYAGFVTSWVPGFVRNDTRLAAQFDTSHHNRYFGNHMGVRPDGTRAANGMDFWWDGQGVGSCWQRPSADGAEPIELPACGAADMPAGLGTARYVAEPGKIFKLYVCANYSQSQQRIPSDCDWFGARGLDRIEVKAALVEALLLGLVLLFLWWRLLRGSGLAVIGVVGSLAGLVVGVFGTLRETTPLTPIGLALLGLGWLCCGLVLRQRGRTGLAVVTLLLAVFALLGAVDRGLVMLPWIPVPPSLVRILLEFVWVPWACVAAAKGRMLAGTTSEPAQTETAAGQPA